MAKIHFYEQKTTDINRKKIFSKLAIRTEDVVADNPYFQNKTTKHESCQIDYLIQTCFNSFYMCEIKFSRNQITSSIIRNMQEKQRRLALPKNSICLPVLIHVNGVSDDVVDRRYFAEIIDFGELLQNDDAEF